MAASAAGNGAALSCGGGAHESNYAYPNGQTREGRRRCRTHAIREICAIENYIFTQLGRNIIGAIIMTGIAKDEEVLIPRIPMIPTDLPFQFKRIQFPLKPAFAMTINKAQGQTLKVAGVHLEKNCFSHGQLYVACSRVSSPNNLHILTNDNKTANVVYKNVLN